MDKDSKYNIPDNYFEDFQERLKVQLEFEEIVGSEKPSVFNVPENYFDVLSQKLTQIPEKTKQTPKIIKLKSPYLLWTVAGIAATFILLFSLMPSLGTTSFESLDTTDIAYYLENESELFDAEDLEELFNEDEINTLELEGENYEEKEIINYLENTADTYDLWVE